MTEAIKIAHLGLNVSILGTARTEEGWEENQTVVGQVLAIEAYLEEPPNVTPQQCTVLVHAEDDNVSVRIDPTLENVTVQAVE